MVIGCDSAQVCDAIARADKMIYDLAIDFAAAGVAIVYLSGQAMCSAMR